MSQPIYYAFSMHKAGSTMFYRLLERSMIRATRLEMANALRYVSIPDALFNSGVPEKVLTEADFPQAHNYSVEDPGTLYGGFRFVPAFATDEFLADKRILLLVRDPRDVLTSLYFSVTSSHRIPQGEAGSLMDRERSGALSESIDDFVLRQAQHGPWGPRFARLNELKDRGQSWRYEDVVFDKRRWFDEILDYLQVALPEGSRREFVGGEDVRPDAEDPKKHIRQVTPGDHQRKLRHETITELSQIFGDTLRVWGYE